MLQNRDNPHFAERAVYGCRKYFARNCGNGGGNERAHLKIGPAKVAKGGFADLFQLGRRSHLIMQILADTLKAFSVCCIDIRLELGTLHHIPFISSPLKHLPPLACHLCPKLIWDVSTPASNTLYRQKSEVAVPTCCWHVLSASCSLVTSP